MSRPLLIGITLAKPGGTTQFVLSLATFLYRRGHNVTVLAGEGEWLFQECQKAGIPIIRVRHLKRDISPLQDVLAAWELFWLFRRERPVAVHLNSSKMGVIGSIAARLARVPNIVYCIGGWSFLENVSSIRKTIYVIAEQISAWFKHHIVCLHPDDEQAAIAIGIPKRKITIIPNGLDVQTADKTRLPREVARAQLGLPQNAFVFGTIANLYPAKNLPSYIKACSQVHTLYPDAVFSIIGEGPERTQIENTIQHHNLKHIALLHGAQKNAARYLNAFDAFVLPSSKEGMPFALLEAMAASLPCIATDVGAHRWMLASSGIIVPSNDTNALAQAMIRIRKNPNATSGRAARELVEQTFSHVACLTRHEKALTSLN